MQNFFSSLFTSQDAPKTEETPVETSRPIELGLAELQQVGGGFGPAGTWAAVQGPAGTW